MEQKTAEEIVQEFTKRLYQQNIILSPITQKQQLLAIEKVDNIELSIVNSINELIKQQQEIAVDKALEMASSEVEFIVCATTYERIGKQSILSLKPEILKELEK